MAQYGKHARDPQVVAVGKHGVALKPAVGALHIVIAVLAVLAVGFVAASFVFSHSELDVQAYADPERASFSELDDAASNIGSSGLPVERVPYASRVTEKLQNSIMSGGCELVSLAIVFESMGIGVDLDDFVKHYLTIDGHFATGYSGDPHYKGAGFPPGIATAANRYLASIDADVRAHNLSGSSFADLRRLVDLGYPVMFWTTMNFGEPHFEGVFDGGREWYSNEHCVVVYGFDRGNALVSDPLDGLVVRDADRFAGIYEQCGSMAVAVY